MRGQPLTDGRKPGTGPGKHESLPRARPEQQRSCQALPQRTTRSHPPPRALLHGDRLRPSPATSPLSPPLALLSFCTPPLSPAGRLPLSLPFPKGKGWLGGEGETTSQVWASESLSWGWGRRLRVESQEDRELPMMQEPKNGCRRLNGKAGGGAQI